MNTQYPTLNPSLDELMERYGTTFDTLLLYKTPTELADDIRTIYPSADVNAVASVLWEIRSWMTED